MWGFALANASMTSTVPSLDWSSPITISSGGIVWRAIESFCEHVAELCQQPCASHPALGALDGAGEPRAQSGLDAGVALGEHVTLEPLKPPDRLVHEPLHLGEAPRDRGSLFAQAIAQSAPDGIGQHDLQLVCGLSERLDLETRAVERSGEFGWQGVSRIHGQPTVLMIPDGRNPSAQVVTRSLRWRCARR